jgi:hypothetical protein
MRSFERSAKDFAGLSGKSQTSRRTLEGKSTDSVNYWNVGRLERANPELRQTQKTNKAVLANNPGALAGAFFAAKPHDQAATAFSLRPSPPKQAVAVNLNFPTL